MENVEIAKVLEEIGDLLDLQEANPFRIRAYRNAAETIRGHGDRIEDLIAAGKDLSKLQGVGKSTASKIKEIVDSGTCERLEELREITPSGLLEMTNVPGLGPKKVMAIYQTLGISTVDGLKEAAENGDLAGRVPGMGAKSEGAILAAIETMPEDTARVPLRTAMEHVRTVGDYLDEVEGIVLYEVAGSFRRGRETVHDLDFLLVVDDRDAAREAVLDYEGIRQEIAAGQEKCSVRLQDGLQVDFRFVEPEVFGSALMYFTGSKAHNIELRKRAIESEWKLSEYGLFEGDEVLASETEEAVYAKLGLDWVPPEIREDRGELMAAEDGTLPDLVEIDDLLGDLHVRAADAKTMRALAEAAIERGYQHLAIACGRPDEAGLQAHLDAVAELNESLPLRVLAAAELGIGEDGTFGLSEELVGELDWVIASIQGARGMGEAKMTDRVVAAVESGLVHCLTHPLGRHVDPVQRVALDLERVLEACAEEEVCIEVGSHPHLFEAPDVLYRRAHDAGVELALSSEASKPEHLWGIELALKTARRAWVTKDLVHNRWTWGE